MKSYTVKSNAKRFARGLVAKHAGIEAHEPEPSGEGEWLPAVLVVGALTEEARAAIEPVAVILGTFQNAGDAFAHLDAALAAEVDADQLMQTVTSGAPTKCPQTVDPSRFVVIDEGEQEDEGDDEAVDDTGPAPTIAGVALVRMAAALPPRKVRTAAEIEAAREERRDRIKAGAYAPPPPAPAKISKGDQVYAAIKASGGASFPDLIVLTGWLKHTLRGYIAGTLRKRAAKEKLTIESVRTKGEDTRYVAQPIE